MALPQQQQPLAFEDYVNATTLEAALAALADGRGTPVAGGTDLWVQKDLGAKRFGARLVNIRHVAALAGVAEQHGRIRLGALASVTDILESPLLRAATPVLPAAADRFASVQIRNAATIGGNIANGSPAADMVVPLLCLDAEVELASWQGNAVATRRVPLSDMFLGPGKTRRAANELIVAIWLDRPAPGFYAHFSKTGPRPALEIARVSLCLAGRRAGGRLTDVRLAYGAVAPTPIRCQPVERMIEGAALDETTIARILDAADAVIAPIDDLRASAWYRRHLARAFLRQELLDAANG
jgi:CO/xanthine dehydrogenase FAD-binding subunit